MDTDPDLLLAFTGPSVVTPPPLPTYLYFFNLLLAKNVTFLQTWGHLTNGITVQPIGRERWESILCDYGLVLFRLVSHSRFSPTPADSVLSRRQPTHIG